MIGRVRKPAPITILMLVIAAAAFAFGEPEEKHVGLEDAEPGDRIEATGTIQTLGSEPHTYFALVVEHNDSTDVTVLRLVGDFDRARSAQGQQMVVRGVLESEPVGPGFPAELRVTEIEPAPRR